MPNRIVREAILTSPHMARLDGWASEVLYRRLLSVVDDFGRYYADPGMLRAACYPRQLNKVSDSDVGKWLSACETAALVRVYPASDGERYLEVLRFRQQTRAKASKFPDPPSECIASATQVPSERIANAPVFGDGDVSGDGDAKEPTALVPALRQAHPPPSCPTDEIIADFHAKCPVLPRVTVLNDARKKAISSRWREVVATDSMTREQGLDWFAWFFAERVAKSDFLMGRRGDFKCSLDWLFGPKNFAKTVDGNYVDKGAS